MLAHLLLDALEVRVGDRHALGELEVVVEAVLDRRPDRDLHAGIELHDRGGEHVRGVVADDVQRAVALRRDDLQRLAGHERAREVAHLAVLAHGERGAREARADRRGGVGAGGAVGELELGAVGKGDVHAPHCHTLERSRAWDSNPTFAIGRCGLTRRQTAGTAARDIPATKGVTMANDELRDRKIAILATDGVEQAELEQPRQALEDAGARTELVSLEEGEIQAMNNDLEPADTFAVEKLVRDASVEDYDALVLPGGTCNPDRLRMDDDAVAFVREFVGSGKLVAAICHGPWTLVEADVVRGRRLTSFPSVRTDLRRAGADVVDEEVVVDDNIVTSRNPDDLPAFCDAIVRELSAVHSSMSAHVNRALVGRRAAGRAVGPEIAGPARGVLRKRRRRAACCAARPSARGRARGTRRDRRSAATATSCMRCGTSSSAPRTSWPTSTGPAALRGSWRPRQTRARASS